MATKKIPVSVYNYTDYRKYLADYFEHNKRRGRLVIMQDVCDDVKIISVGHLSSVMHGKANMSKDLTAAFAKYCRLKKKESEYFKTMVFFNQTKSHSKKKKYFEELVSFRMSCVYKVCAHMYQYYDKWYHSAIRALCEFMDIRDNHNEVALMLIPSIREHEAKNSINLLAELELVEADENGFYRPIDKYIDTGGHATSTSINNYLAAMMDKAKESLDRFPGDEKKLSWITLGLDEAGYEEFLQEVRNFRYRVGELVQRHKANRVYQVNMQIFPLSKTYPNQKKE
ncbi:MAG: TIGR02147 family protein [Fibrobacteria bacterium]|nr:TIGR02147 family protein [Fibrobacteria bacterium]